MKLLIVYQNYRNSYTGLSDTYIREFKKQVSNIEIFEFKPVSYNLTINRVLNRIHLLKLLYYKWQNNKFIQKIRKIKPDIIIVMKGTDLESKSLKKVKESFPEIVTACFNPDDPFNNRSCKKNIIDSIPYYDHYFIWTKKLIEPIKKVGASQVHYLPFATDTTIIYPPPIIGEEFINDLCFIGNGDEERQKWVSSIADAIEETASNISFDIYGANWKAYKNIKIHHQVNGLEMLKCLTQSKININILRLQNKDSTNMRTFEIPAARSLMFHERSKEAQEIFKEDEEVIFFDNAKDLVEKANRIINNNSLRDDILNKGYLAATSSENLYSSRVESILNTLKSYKK